MRVRKYESTGVRSGLAVVLAAVLVLGGCRGRDGAQGQPRRGETAPARTAAAWRTNPAAGEALKVFGDSLTIETGPHTILWPATARALTPPYTIRATFTKHRGRLHEGYGILFGGSGLEGAETGQAYSYLLVRGDGSFLVKRRQGAETPVVRDWTQNPVIRRDLNEEGQPNLLEVAVTDSVTVFRVNRTEVARVPSSELSVRGLAGVRTSHECLLAVEGFTAEPGAAEGGSR